MKYVQINSVPNGSTGNVMMRTKEERIVAGDECWTMWGRGRSAENDYEYNFGDKFGFYSDVLLTRFDGKTGFHSKVATSRLIAKLEEIDPDVVHLHNIHGYYINIDILFNWLSKHRCHVNWTLHDCWAFTGHCVHFTYAKCTQWQSHCAYSEPCCQVNAYPKTISKSSVRRNFARKRELFTMLPESQLTLFAPSEWLADSTRQSFLAKYPVEVHHNTIDTQVFKPTSSDFREHCGLQDKFVVLGIASPWTERKGLDDFVRLANELDDRFAVVLVGLSEQQIKQMSTKVTTLSRAASAEGLTEAYVSSDLLVKSSIAEAFAMTVVKSLACDTRVLISRKSACKEAIETLACGNTLVSDLDFESLKETNLTVGEGCKMILLGRTESKRQLAALYSMTNVFFNPTQEDNYPTVNLEARACGAVIWCYDVGGCRETLS